MLVICPKCSTSYMLDPATVGPAGRTVRCARCRNTWFANAPEPQDPVEAFVDGVIAEAEAEVAGHGHELQRAEALSTGLPVHARDLDEVVVVEGQSEPQESLHVVDSPPLMPEQDLRLAAEEAAPEELESFAERRRRVHSRRQKARRSSRWTATILVLLAFNVALIGARHEVVHYLPQTASLFAAVGLPVNLRQLAFEDMRVTKETENGIAMVSIEGRIVSQSKKPVEVPRLRFAARNAQGREVYTWTARPERSLLPPGESLEFHSFAKPPAEATDVMVRFFSAKDAAAGK